MPHAVQFGPDGKRRTLQHVVGYGFSTIQMDNIEYISSCSAIYISLYNNMFMAPYFYRPLISIHQWYHATNRIPNKIRHIGFQPARPPWTPDHIASVVRQDGNPWGSPKLARRRQNFIRLLLMILQLNFERCVSDVECKNPECTTT